MTPIEPGSYALAASLAGPPMPPILATPGVIRPRQLGPMIRAPRMFASSTISATSRRGIRSVTTTISLIAVLDRLDHRVLGEGGGDGDHGAVGGRAVVLDDLLDRVEDGHAVDLAALAARGDPADDLRAEVEALAGQVHGLAAGDALDDEGEVLVQQDGHQVPLSLRGVRLSSGVAVTPASPIAPSPLEPWTLATARPAASHMETVRSQYSIPYLSRIL